LLQIGQVSSKERERGNLIHNIYLSLPHLTLQLASTFTAGVTNVVPVGAPGRPQGPSRSPVATGVARGRSILLKF